jgi:hypothetical protein
MMYAILKRIGTILCIIGMFLTAFNFYPINIVFSAIGSSMWAAVGFGIRDKDLFVVEITAVIFAITGLIWWCFSPELTPYLAILQKSLVT